MGGESVAPVVYVDVLFVTNFICDLFLLYMTRTVYKNKSPAWRMLCGAALGSVYAVAIFFPDLTFMASAFIKLFASAVIVVVSFKIHTLREFMMLLLLFYLSGFVLAGISFALFFLTGFGSRVGAAMSNGVFYINVNPLYVMCGAAICYATMFVGEKLYVKRLLRHANMHKITIAYRQRSVSVPALLDTANYACDPVTNMAVIVCDMKAALPLFEGESFYKKLCQAESVMTEVLALELVCDTPFRLVPYKPLGTDVGFMIAFEPHRLEIDGRECICSVLVGLCAKAVMDSADYGALLHPRIMDRLGEESEVV